MAVSAAILANANVLDPTVTQQGMTIFTNGLDTRTQLAEMVVSFTSSLGKYGSIN